MACEDGLLTMMTSGIYHVDTIKDVADSLGIVNLPDNVATMLSSDVEYRLNQVIEEAARFTRHSKRTTLTTSDIDQAFKVLNIEVRFLLFKVLRCLRSS